MNPGLKNVSILALKKCQKGLKLRHFVRDIFETKLSIFLSNLRPRLDKFETQGRDMLSLRFIVTRSSSRLHGPKMVEKTRNYLAHLDGTFKASVDSETPGDSVRASDQAISQVKP